jgi:hypothetical protein
MHGASMPALSLNSYVTLAYAFNKPMVFGILSVGSDIATARPLYDNKLCHQLYHKYTKPLNW